MHRQGRSTLSSFQRVQEFLAQHPFSEESAALGAQLSELNDVIAQLVTESVSQESSSRFVRAHVESQRKLRARLYTEHMTPISRVAREVFGATGMDRAFLMPRRATVNQVLLAAAGFMAEAAAKWKDVFLQHGLPQDFIEQLTSATSALEEARNARTESARQRVTATASLNDLLKRGRRAVRMLDAILRPRLVKDPELLAAWQSAKRVPPASPPKPATDESSGTAVPAGTEKAA